MWNNIKFVRKIKTILPLGIKLVLIRVLVLLQYVFYMIFPKKNNEVLNNKRKIFVMLSTDYSNLGDHAMTFAQIKLLKERFPDSQIVEVLVGDTLKYFKQIRSIISNIDVITLKGGGNIGLEYFREELYRRIIINKFKNNKIVIFPQTVYFPNTSRGIKELNNTVKVIKGHPKLYTFIRDQKSINTINNQVTERLYLIPDTALSLSNLDYTINRKGVTICLRSDKEGLYSINQKNMIKEISDKFFDKVKVTDTVTDYSISIQERERELEKIWKTFSNSELVITDRLHGMIFAVITSTPCIVLKTYNHKVVGQYEWISYLNYIELIELEEEELEKSIEKLLNIKVNPYSSLKFKEMFEKLTDVIE